MRATAKDEAGRPLGRPALSSCMGCRAYGDSGTVIAPEMIWAFRSSS